MPYISKVARAFGCLQKSIFQNRHLSVETKRKVYKAAVLSVLLYGAETWTIKAGSVRRLSGFHNRCIRTIMGISRYQQQWKEHTSSRRLAAGFGMEETIADLLMHHRLRWLGHLARMEDHRMPKQLLFGEVTKKRPAHGAKRRWRDVVAADVKSVGVSETWYDQAQDRRAWRVVCRDGIKTLVDQHRYGACAANRAELAATSAFVDGPSDGRGTLQGTAASVAVLAQQSPSPPFVILSRAVLPKDTAIISRWVAPRSKVCAYVCVHACVCVSALHPEDYTLLI